MNVERKKCAGLLLYLSGAPRVGTRPDCAVAGARSHILGVMSGFQDLGWEIEEFILGNLLPSRVGDQESERAMKKNRLRRFLADCARIILYGVLPYWAKFRARRKPTWVYERMGSFQAVGRVFQRGGLPWILESNAIGFREGSQDRLGIFLVAIARWIELRAYRQCDLIVTVSETLKSEIISESGVKSEKIIVVPNGVDLQRFDPDKYDPVRYFPDQFVIGFVGVMYHWQSLPDLIRAVQKLRAEGVPLALVFVGDGEALEICQKTVDEAGLRSFCRFTGFISPDEIPSHYLGFDLSYSGQAPLSGKKMYHSPLKLYESLAMGVPVLASRFEDAEREVKEGETGFLFESKSQESLEMALRKAWSAKVGGNKARIRAQALKNGWTCRVERMIADVNQELNARSNF